MTELSVVEEQLKQLVYLMGFIARDTDEWKRSQLRTALLREDQ